MSGPARPVVAVLRREWLRPSETFIRDHVESLTRWQPVTGAFLRLPDPLLEPDCHVMTTSRVTDLMQRRGPRAPWDRRLAALIARHRPDVVHVHFGVDAWHLLGVHAKLDVPLFVTFHGYDVSATASPAMRDYFRHIDEVFRAAHTLLAVSDFVAERLRDLGAPPEKIHTQVNGISLRRFGAHTESGPPPASILFVGRLVEKKGLRDLLTALDTLPPDLRGTPLHVVGDGPLDGELRAYARALRLNVTFHARAGHDEVARLMRTSRLVAIPSRRAADGDSEGLPTVAVEAAATGRAVVATRHAGMPEIVRDGVTGLLVPEGDTDALAAALARTLTDDALTARMGRAAREVARDRFDLHRQTARLEQRYDQAMKGVTTTA